MSVVPAANPDILNTIRQMAHCTTKVAHGQKVANFVRIL